MPLPMKVIRSDSAGGGGQTALSPHPPACGGAETRIVSAAASCPLSKLRAAALTTAVPDLMPTMRPASTVTTLESLLDQTNATFGIGNESGICHARATATVSRPWIRILSGVRVTRTDASCSVG